MRLETPGAPLGFALAAAGVLCFSLRPIFIKLAYEIAQDPVTLLALRMAFAAPFFAVVAWWTSRRDGVVPMSRRDALYVLVLGLLSYYAASYLDFLALQFISAGLGRLLLFLYPTIVVLLSAVVLRRGVTAREVVALALTYAGLAVVLWQNLGNPLAGEHRAVLLGAALALASSVCYATYLVAGAEVIGRVGSLRFSGYAMVAAALACILQFALLRDLSALDLPVGVYGYALAMAVFSTVIPVFLTSEALRRIGANAVAIVGALGPVSTIGLGWIGLEETLSALQVVGVVLVLVGVLVVTVAPGRS